MKKTCLAWHTRIQPLSCGGIATFSFLFSTRTNKGTRRGRAVPNFLKRNQNKKKFEGCRCCLAPIPPTSCFLKRSMLGYALTRSLAHTYSQSYIRIFFQFCHYITHSVARLFTVYASIDLRLVSWLVNWLTQFLTYFSFRQAVHTQVQQTQFVIVM